MMNRTELQARVAKLEQLVAGVDPARLADDEVARQRVLELKDARDELAAADAAATPLTDSTKG